MVNIDQIKDLIQRVKYLKSSLNIDDKNKIINEKELLTQKNDFWRIVSRHFDGTDRHCEGCW